MGSALAIGHAESSQVYANNSSNLVLWWPVPEVNVALMA